MRAFLGAQLLVCTSASIAVLQKHTEPQQGKTNPEQEDINFDKLDHALGKVLGSPQKPKYHKTIVTGVTGQERKVLAEMGRMDPWFNHTVPDDGVKCPQPFRLKPRPHKSHRKQTLLQTDRRRKYEHSSEHALGRDKRAWMRKKKKIIDDRRYIVPGSGGTQIKADNGLSTTGSVNGEEPQKKVYKDGFFEVGCYADSMVEFGDKFGNNADQYRMQHTDMSVVWYKEIVLKENQEAMKPEVCFQFCRTVPSMGYFGITNGDGCYCTPYHKPMESGSSICNVPCTGDTTQMCGGAEKSTVWEMHWCNDAAADVKKTAGSAVSTILFFEREAWELEMWAGLLDETGTELQKIAGLGGDVASERWAQMAKERAGELKHLLWDGVCYKSFHELQDTYHSAEDTSSIDLGVPDNLDRADAEIADMKELSKTTYDCAVKAEQEVTATYPWHVEFMESELALDYGRSWWNNHIAEAEEVSMTFYPLQYGLNPSKDAAFKDISMSTCGGEPIGAPRILYWVECAAACEAAVYPEKCIGFQHYSFGNKEWKEPLCILIKEFTSLTQYDCPMLWYYTQYWFLQKDQKTTHLRHNYTKDVKQSSNSSVAHTYDPFRFKEIDCDIVKVDVFFAGMTCEQMYGKDSRIIEKCPTVCSKAKGSMSAASCFVRLADLATGGMPKIEVTKVKKCFGGDTNKLSSDSPDPPEALPRPDEDATITSGTESMKPTKVWTDGPVKRLTEGVRP